MAELNTLSNVAGDHTAAPPEGAPEGWVGADVNNVVRELLAKIYRWYQNPEWVDITYRLPAVGVKTFTQLSTTSFRIASCDARLTVTGDPGFAVGRRFRLRQGGSSFYGMVLAVAFTAGNTDVTALMDTGTNVPATIDDAYLNGATLQRLAFLPGPTTVEHTPQINISGHQNWDEVPVARGYFNGFGLTRSAPMDIAIAAGTCKTTDNARTARSTGMTKRLDAVWASGNGNGGRAGALVNGTWYHVFLIQTSNQVDFGFDTSVTAVNLLAASGFLRYRRLGSVFYIDGVSFIKNFFQQGQTFYFTDPTLSVDTTISATASTHSLAVPLGFVVTALLNVYAEHPTNSRSIYLSALAASDLLPSDTAAPLGQIRTNGSGADNVMGTLSVLTNTSQQIRARASGASTFFRVATLGWIDNLS